ncbi:hypothetical protein [Mammaliicoccus sp. Dog046]|uniref:hypothetical protein n=1 Tax=Mammaliicoccus sp. Dog046 TaxID=3034233 RepID=UPI002B25CDDD|nr:hypothetical protein [Mammaliicoccus sp. Dog046]WQK86624.1 hypothetical protein P3U32_06310 [Mammaliicoccus sp. Dog046]
MKKFIFNQDGFILPFLLCVLFIYSAFISYYLVQYHYKLMTYRNLEDYYQSEIKLLMDK